MAKITKSKVNNHLDHDSLLFHFDDEAPKDYKGKKSRENRLKILSIKVLFFHIKTKENLNRRRHEIAIVLKLEDNIFPLNMINS